MLFTQFVKERQHVQRFDRHGDLEAENGVLDMEAVKIHSNPNIDLDSWGKDVSHFECTITNKETGKSASFFYSQGSAYGDKKPKLIDVLYSLVYEAQEIQDTRFEVWCGDYGCDTDSIEARRTYDAIVENSLKLEVVLGDLWTEAMQSELDY